MSGCQPSPIYYTATTHHTAASALQSDFFAVTAIRKISRVAHEVKKRVEELKGERERERE
jgi:hypothetical protein